MKKTTKATLMSAFILPGAGHLYLKSYFTATVLVATAFLAFYVLVSNAVERALLISDKIIAGEVPPDISVITEMVSNQSVGDDARLIEWATMGLVIAWLVGIADSYRVGRLQEKSLEVDA